MSVPGKENKKLVQGDRKLKIHTAIVETLIHTAEKVPSVQFFYLNKKLKYMGFKRPFNQRPE